MEIKSLNRAEAFRYMGQRGEITAQLKGLVDECEKELLKAIKPRYVYKAFGIEHSEIGVVIKNTTLTLEGWDIKEHLKDCTKCVLLCATVSADVDKLVRTYEATDMAKAFVADSLASVAVEQVCNKAEEEIKNKLDGYNFTWRFSPGYGDFPIDLQQKFLEILDAPKRIGVNTTENMLLVPRKSVTAVIGLSKGEISKGKRGCVSCNMYGRCEYRLRGEHCGV